MRHAVPQAARAAATIQTFPGPIAGLVLNRAAPPPLKAIGCEVADNFIATQRGLRVRGGYEKRATIGEAPMALMVYNTPAPAFFAASEARIYDITDLDPDTVADAVWQGQTGGDYCAQQMGTAGGQFLIAVNGVDLALVYDGGDWNPLTDEAVSDLAYDALTLDFDVGETVTGGTSGASATILSIQPATATTGVLKVGTITSGPFQDNEALTSAGGAATANGASASASALTITGVDTAELTQVWLYRNRLFFVEGGTLRAWYLPVASVGGSATSLSLAGIFQRGGSLVFGATWSLDSGDGLDDKCVFVSDQGEVAIYEGSDPSDADTWGLVGRYDMAPPLGKRGHITAGGDILIATTAGIIPLSQVLVKDPAALNLAAITSAIEPLWAKVALTPVEFVKWSARDLGLCVFPGRALPVKLQSGAWTNVPEWGSTCCAVYSGSAYIGLSDGRIVALDETGSDDGEPFTARYCGSFQDFRQPAVYKQAQLARFHFYAVQPFTYSRAMGFDFDTRFGAAASANEASVSADYGIWNQDNWNGGALWYSTIAAMRDTSLIAAWETVTGAGYSLAPKLQVTSSGDQKLPIELTMTEVAYEAGGVVV